MFLSQTVASKLPHTYVGMNNVFVNSMVCVLYLQKLSCVKNVPNIKSLAGSINIYYIVAYKRSVDNSWFLLAVDSDCCNHTEESKDAYGTCFSTLCKTKLSGKTQWN